MFLKDDSLVVRNSLSTLNLSRKLSSFVLSAVDTKVPSGCVHVVDPLLLALLLRALLEGLGGVRRGGRLRRASDPSGLSLRAPGYTSELILGVRLIGFKGSVLEVSVEDLLLCLAVLEHTLKIIVVSDMWVRTAVRDCLAGVAFVDLDHVPRRPQLQAQLQHNVGLLRGRVQPESEASFVVLLADARHFHLTNLHQKELIKVQRITVELVCLNDEDVAVVDV